MYRRLTVHKPFIATGYLAGDLVDLKVPFDASFGEEGALALLSWSRSRTDGQVVIRPPTNSTRVELLAVADYAEDAANGYGDEAEEFRRRGDGWSGEDRRTIAALMQGWDRLRTYLLTLAYER